MKNIISLLFFLLLFLSISAQDNLEEQMDELLKKYFQESEIGTACLISKNGKILFENYQGYANLEHKIKVNSKSKFLIGSVTKQFTAAAILLLEEQGKLSTEDFIEDFIENYIPLFEKKKYPFTIHHLLTHTSGIPSDNASNDIQNNIESDLSPEVNPMLIF